MESLTGLPGRSTDTHSERRMQPFFQIRPSLHEQLAVAAPLFDEMLSDVATGKKYVVLLRRTVTAAERLRYLNGGPPHGCRGNRSAPPRHAMSSLSVFETSRPRARRYSATTMA